MGLMVVRLFGCFIRSLIRCFQRRRRGSPSILKNMQNKLTKSILGFTIPSTTGTLPQITFPFPFPFHPLIFLSSETPLPSPTSHLKHLQSQSSIPESFILQIIRYFNQFSILLTQLESTNAASQQPKKPTKTTSSHSSDLSIAWRTCSPSQTGNTYLETN